MVWSLGVIVPCPTEIRRRPGQWPPIPGEATSALYNLPINIANGEYGGGGGGGVKFEKRAPGSSPV